MHVIVAPVADLVDDARFLQQEFVDLHPLNRAGRPAINVHVFAESAQVVVADGFRVAEIYKR